ncbi:MAG TPA: nucleoside triphosphate pyrophosphohydrolase, partial [Stellaceae bacterium]|nr:nucleoside triphosphate pyrophosphohydrolase [Stellaceae bacterium]
MNDLPALRRLLDIMARLRDPLAGCPWDLQQDFTTIAPYTIEEAYEVAEAAETGDAAALKDELGDLLLQTVFHSRIAEEAGLFDFEEVARTIGDKMERRHPHIFTEAAAVVTDWEQHKEQERHARGASSALDGVGVALPALTRAEKLQARAARVGFDWPASEPVFDKIQEEIAELRAELDSGASRDRVLDEMGDLLFAVANLARKLDIDPEQALRAGCRKFERRFRAVEADL